MNKFSQAPLCPKCNNNWITWTYIDSTRITLEDFEIDHFKLQCQRCDFIFQMHTKDYVEEDNE